MEDIKLFVCCHQPFPVPKHPLLFPVQAGAALSDTRFPGFLYDDTGDNISAWNRSYCELTVQYWAWKNVTAEYYGFFHYRRYLYPDTAAKRAYRIACKPDSAVLRRLGYAGFPALIRSHDLILPKGENMHIPVREHYANAPSHHRKDLALTEALVRTHSPEYADAMEAYLAGTLACFGNIFIMRRALFHRYCEWLFGILEEFDRQVSYPGGSAAECRVDGYLAERLFGIFAAHIRDDPAIRSLELPRVHFSGSVGGFLKNKAVCTVLPPGTYRRALVKKVCT